MNEEGEAALGPTQQDIECPAIGHGEGTVEAGMG